MNSTSKNQNILSPSYRNNLLKELKNIKFDLIIIGGGITGAGILLDATLRGLTAVLLEKNDFASGTSSRSTKLIHGGLRYLKNFEFGLVREVGQERKIAYQNAMNLVRPEPMLLPLSKKSEFTPLKLSFGLWLYDLLGGTIQSEKRKILKYDATLEQEPLLNRNEIRGGGLYYEYRTDDARLTLEVIKTAVHHGGFALNYAEVLSFEYETEKVCGINLTDHLGGSNFQCYSTCIVNATGPWTDQIRNLDLIKKQPKLFLSKGVHLVFRKQKLPVKQSLYFGAGDGRMVFAIPRGDMTYVGTTDTAYKGSIDNPEIDTNDVSYLLDTLNRFFPTINLELTDIVSSWAGLRPLILQKGKGVKELSRKDEIYVSATNLITIAGGKLTAYRKMSERVLDLVVDKFFKKSNLIIHKCKTKTTKLRSCNFDKESQLETLIRKVNTGLDLIENEMNTVNVARNLVHLYGNDVSIILEKAIEFKRANKLPPLLLAQLWYGVYYESVQNLQDFFIRRTGMIYFEPEKIPMSMDALVFELGSWLGWDDKKMESEKIIMTEIYERVVLKNLNLPL